MRRSLLLAIAVLLGLTACGGSPTGTGNRVLDFAAVPSGQTEVEVAADGTSAVIRLRMDPPTVCAVAYGESEELGLIANDPGMGGLRDLRPRRPAEGTDGEHDVPVPPHRDRRSGAPVPDPHPPRVRDHGDGDGRERPEHCPTRDRGRVELRVRSFTDRRLRFEVVASTGGNTGAAEVEVLGALRFKRLSEECP